MKKIIIIGVIAAIVLGGGGFYVYTTFINPPDEEVMAEEPVYGEYVKPEANDFLLYVDNVQIGEFETFDEAMAEVTKHSYKNAGITYVYQAGYVWDNYPEFQVGTSTNDYKDFDTYIEAMDYARTFPRAFVYYRKNYGTVWSNVSEIPEHYQIADVPMILQNPELPRGCEVTSLAMLLNYYDISVGKILLADEIAKDDTPYTLVDNRVYAGHPNIGFVGSMSDSSQFGYGVYHRPVYDLLSKYMPYSAIDLTGGEFDEILYLIAYGSPVWVLTNATYDVLPIEEFERWSTPYGDVDITYNMHAVLVTGYDNINIYFNDPLGRETFAPREEFIKAWEQMGRQAVASVEIK